MLKAALIDSRPLLAAALFVEFDADGSGEVSRDEFVAHVWMLLRASEEQRQRFTFAKLDVNRSGALERSDLVASMRRQLSIARTLSPLLVQLQLRRHALTETSPRPLRDLSETCLGVKTGMRGLHERLQAVEVAIPPAPAAADTPAAGRDRSLLQLCGRRLRWASCPGT